VFRVTGVTLNEDVPEVWKRFRPRANPNRARTARGQRPSRGFRLSVNEYFTEAEATVIVKAM